MKLISYIKILIFITISLILYVWYTGRHNVILEKLALNKVEAESNELKHEQRENNIVIVTACCGDRFRESLNMIKSAIIFSQSSLSFIIFTEDKLILDFEEKLAEWKEISQNRFKFKIMPLSFPKENAEEWRKLFHACASQRLFLPSFLSDVDAVLYVDTDTLFLSPPDLVWEHFYKMNSSQMAALVPEHEDPNTGWYNRFARHPYYGKLGVNSGVMLMNITKMRLFQWADYVVPIYKKYKLNITWGDQDIINIIFHFHPDKLFVFGCEWNYRPDHCMYMNICKTAEPNGVHILHGNRGVFHSENQPLFNQIYKTFDEYQLGSDLNQEFYLPFEYNIETTTHTNCGKLKNNFLKNVKKYLHFEEDVFINNKV